MRLQSKILLLLLPLIIVPLISLGWIAYRQLQTTSHRTVLKQMDTLLNQVELHVAFMMWAACANIDIFSNSTLFKRYILTTDENERYGLLQPPLLRLFASYQHAYPDYYEIRVILPDGFEDVRSTLKSIPNATEAESSSRYFTEMLASPDDIYTTFSQNPDNRKVAFYIFKKLILTDPSIDPISRKPSLKGFLAITADLTSLEKQVEKNKIGKNGFIFFTDDHGNILFHPDADEIGKTLPAAIFKQLSSHTKSTKIMKAVYHDQPLIIQGRNLHPDLYLFSALPEPELLVESRKLRIIVTLITVITIITTVGLIFLALKLLVVSPIKQLGKAIRQVGKGNLDINLSTDKQDEIAELAAEFNHMAMALKNSEAQKADAQQKLRQSQKMEVIATLAGGVAHDLNNILAGLVSYPDLLLLDLPKDSPLRTAVVTIKKSGEKASTIVQDLLTLGRRGVSMREVVNLNQIISDYLQSPEHERLIYYHPFVDVETCLGEELLNIMGSPVHLSKTIMNLVSNAAEAMPDDGKITIATENRHMDGPVSHDGVVKEGDYVLLRVSDTGVGISREDMKRIFEPFYTKKKMGRSGTGLGMAVVWGTVKDHKGYVDVQSTEGRGTTFTLYFPVTRKALKDKTDVPIQTLLGNGESMLVVDDVKEQREIATQMLNKLNYSVQAVSSGEEAVYYVQKTPVDLIVLDMIMDPGMDGYDTYKKITEIYPAQRAIIASGYADNARVKDTQRLGAGAFLKKPYTLVKIAAAVKEALSG